MSIGYRGRAMRTAAFAAILAAVGAPVMADEIFHVSGVTGNAVEDFKKIVAPWEASTGHTVTMVPMPSSTTDQFAQYRLWLAAGSTDIDVYATDVIWAPQLADSFVDLAEVAKDLAPTHFPAIIESQTVNGKPVALPMFTDAPALYYRKDLLEKYGVAVPKTWAELTTAAQTIQDGEKAANPDFWGFVWQGNAYEGLTCNALEWVKSFGGGQIVEPDGTISINNPKAVAALVKPWEEATGNTVTMVPMPASTTDQFGQYRLWLAAGNADVDIYQTDVIWAPQLADSFLDLTEAAKDLAPEPFPLDHRIADGERQAGCPADLYRCAGAVLPQGPVGKVWRSGAENLGRADCGGAGRTGWRARRRQGRFLGFCLAGQCL